MEKTIYYNGVILTLAEGDKEAAGVLVEEGIIQKVVYADTESLLLENPDAQIVDLQGNVLIPGFIDGHSHFLQNTLTLLYLDGRPSPLGKADSVEELLKRLKEQLEDAKYKKQEYLFAWGYDEAVYPDHRIPTRWDLDQVTEKPLALTHASGHNTLFNSAALRLAGIGEDYVPPQGGSVGRSSDGRLTGIFYETAAREVLPKSQLDDQKVLEKGLDMVIHQYISKGVTTAQDGGTPKKWYDSVRDIVAAGRLPIDLVSYIMDLEPEEVLNTKESQNGTYVNRYRAAGLKIFLDGSPQAKTAWMSEPYFIPPENEEPDYRGYGIYKDEEITEIFKKALTNRWQVNVHTNGDEAIEQFIRTYQNAIEETGIMEDLRPVSIHCQTVREEQLDRMKELGFLASFFVDHTFYWGDYHEAYVLGTERARRISPLASALKRNISFSLHQDTPVTEQNPLFAVHNAVNRRTRSGKILGEEFCISPLEALKAVTIHAAYQIFEEDKKGSIEVGKLADFAILNNNPLTVSPEKIKEISVLETIKEGRTIYRSSEKFKITKGVGESSW
ncbi:MAG: amidohydrolase [Muricomes sp.]